MKHLRVLVVGAVLLAALAFSAGTASADPKPGEGESLTLNCGNGDIAIVSNGGGQWTAAQDLGSNRVFQPIGFGPTFFELRNADTGEILDSDFDPTVVTKNGNRKGQSVRECTFLASFSGFDPELGINLEGEFGGTVFIKA